MTSNVGSDDLGAAHDLSAAVPGTPEDRQVFRLAQLVLLLEVAMANNISVNTVDRLGFYDFFAANPFIVTSGKEAVTPQIGLP